MSAFESLLGDTLRKPDGQEVKTVEALSDMEAVGIYFSAHWCPPCRGFTPVLGETYKKLRESGKKFEIVFVSSDKDDEQFNSYHGEHPWLAVPFAKRDLKNEISKKYKVAGIPTLVILDKDGNTITTDGRESVGEDPEGEHFPWTPPTFEDCAPTTLVKNDGSEVKWADLKDTVIGLYFSAHWCPPCKAFTPQLAEKYKKIKEAGKNFEIVFVSSDRDEEQFKEYFAEMPWLALPFEDRKRKAMLSQRFGVEGIPTLTIINHDGSVINANGRGAVGGDADGSDFPWHPKPVNKLSSPDGINENTSLIVFADGCDEAAQKSLESDLTAIAKPEIDAAKAKGEDPEMIFFIADEAGDGVTGRVRTLTKVGDAVATAQMAILDIPDNGGYYVFEGEVNSDSIKAFMADFRAKKLDRKQLG